ncbi:MAG: 30S ribosome-binding factor RbfA [Flavobacteriaceae bacterium]
MESQRQKKIAGVIQKDLADILQRAATDGGMQGTLISVSKVSVTVDLSIAKVYVSIFPTGQSKEVMEGLRSNQPLIRHEMAQRTRHQFRRMPQLIFFHDDSLDYIENIEKSLEEREDPIEKPELLPRRKKS